MHSLHKNQRLTPGIYFVSTIFMPQKTKKVIVNKCNACGYEWQSRFGEKPIACARCKSPYWDRPKKIERPKQSSRFIEARA